MKLHTVRQLARLSGVSVRTLHHYDRIGLLKPQRTSSSGYRLYGEAELLRLQQILLHRELDLPLARIAGLLALQGRSRIEMLEAHRAALAARAVRCHELIDSIDHTIAALTGALTMQAEQLYQGFSAEKQAEHEAWLIGRYGPSMREELVQSKARARETAPEVLEMRMRELAALESALSRQCLNGVDPAHPGLESLLRRHRSWVAGMWGRPCSPEAYAYLAELYESHPEFRERYETLASGFADFLPAAMRAFAARTVSG